MTSLMKIFKQVKVIIPIWMPLKPPVSLPRLRRYILKENFVWFQNTIIRVFAMIVKLYCWVAYFKNLKRRKYRGNEFSYLL